MRRLALLLCLLPSLSAAQAITQTDSREALLGSWMYNSAASGTTCPGVACAGTVLPSRSFAVKAVALYVSSASGGGAGSTVITITDGTATCTATWLCTATATLGAYRVNAANGAATGCEFPPGAALTWYVSASTCTTTQPTLKLVHFMGRWR